MTEGTSNTENVSPEAPADKKPDAAPKTGTGDAGTSGDAGASGEAGTSGTAGPKRRRRGKRGGKRHRKPGTGSSAESSDESSDSPSDKPPARPSTRSSAGRSSTAAASRRPAAAGTGAEGAEDASSEPAGASPARGTPRPRGKRTSTGASGTRTRTAAKRPAKSNDESPSPAGDDAASAAAGDAAAGDAAAGTGAEDGAGEPGTAPARRRRGRRGGRGRTKKPDAEGGDEGEEKADAATPAAAKTAKTAKTTQSGGRGRGGAAAKPDAKSDGKPASTRLRARQQRSQQRPRRPHRKLSEEEAMLLRGQDKVMLIHQHDERTQIGVLAEGVLIEHYVARAGARTTMAGNVFLGKVQNVLPGMEAAFIDFGRGRNGVLYAGEVNYSAEDLEGDHPKRIEHVLKPGQKVMVQVTKDPIGNKGARLTSQVSLAGRYLVLAPDQAVTGISKRLAENERTRLRQILRDIRPDGHGVIVRTAAEGASQESLKRDLDHLVKIWDEIKKNAKKAPAPSELHGEPGLILRVARDEFSDDFTKLVVDSREVYEKVKGYLEATAPDLLPKLELHEGALSLFEEYRVSEQLQKALERKVWLPSGGSIIIERTEALTVVDVNTGKFTGKGSTLEDTVFANNLEAAEEVARQLRLRDIGGIIVIDFIDMIEQKNQREMLRAFKGHLAKDKTRSQVFEVSNLGLVEMTRKKVSEGLLDAFSEPCPNCDGRGIVITHEID